MRILNCCFALALLQAAVVGQSSDYYVSSPAAGGIYRGDFVTGASTPLGLGLLVPHYGWFGNDGNFYVPDRGWPALMKVTPAGDVSFFAVGGALDKPVTVVPTLDDTAMLLSDMGNKIFRIEYDGSQTLLYDNTNLNGMLDWPDGMAWDADGNLYVANLASNNIIKIDPQGQPTLFSDSPLIDEPGGIAIDGAGNMFVANYASSTIARFRLDGGGVGEVFAGPNVGLMAHPNDLKLSRKGGMLASARQGAVLRIDALGNIAVAFSDPTLQELDGVSVPEDATLCSGTFTNYGTGTAGSGGFVPKMRAIYSPCPGQTIGLEMRDMLGGAPAVLFVGTSPLPDGAVKLKGAGLLVNPSGTLFLPITFTAPGAGAGQGKLTLQFSFPDESWFVGMQFYHQVFVGDPAGPSKVAASDGLHEVIGS